MDVAGAARLTLAVDFDATLNSYVSGFTDVADLPDPPVEGAIAWLYDVAAAFDLVVFTNRASSPEGIAAVINWLTEHGFVGVPYLVTDVKPVAVMYVDDRGWHFAGPGTYPTVAEILAFRPWNDAEQHHSPPSPPTTSDELAVALAARAGFAEPWLTAAVARAVSAAGGRLTGLDDRLKSRAHLAGKIEATVAADGVTPLVAAGLVNDAVRYTAVLDAGRYTVGAKKALVALTALGLTVVRVRNYWAYDGDVSGADTSGTYVGANVVLETRDGYPFEVQFHTPESLEAQKVNWDGYRRLRKGDLEPRDRAATVERMRAVNAAVPEPPRARKLRLAGGTVVAAAAPAAPSAATHSETLRAAADMALRLEGKLAALIQPILARAGADAAAAFRAKATDHLTAAADDGVTPTMAMVCVMPTEAQQDALASPGGNDARTLHATLVFLGEVEGSLEPLRAALAPVAASHAPLRGRVGGCGRFDPPGVGILLPDVPGLVELRVAVTEALAAAGIDYSRDHGFEAHITVGDPDAVDPDGDERAGLPLDFDDLLIVRGDVERVALPLVGPPPLTAAGKRKAIAVTEVTEVTETTGAVELTLLEARRELAAAEAAARDAAAEHDAALAAGDAKRLAAATKKMEDARRRVAAANRRLQDAVQPPREPVAPDIVQKAADAKAPTVAPDTVKNVVDLTSKTTDRLPGNVDEIRSVLREAIDQGKKGDIAKKIASDLKVPRDDVLAIGFGDGLGYELEQALGKPLDDYWKYAPQATWSKPAVDELLPGDRVASEVRRVTGPVVQTVVKNVAGAAVGRVGIAFDVTNPHIARVIDRAGQQVTGIVQTTKDDIRKVIDGSYAKGLSIPHTAEEIQNVLTDSSFARATLIARTELVGAVNGASLAATNVVADATGAAYQKSWMTAPGAPHPRHEDYDGLDGQTVELDQPFDVGGEALMYPGDPDGDVSEVANCRCSMEYVDGSGQAVGDAVEADTLAEGGGGDLAATQPAGLVTDDPMAAARALAAGDYVTLNQPAEIATTINDLGKAAAEAQAAGRDAANLDLGRVSVKGTNLFTLDSKGVARVDMPQLKGFPVPGSLADALPRDARGEVDVAPLFYQHLRDQGVQVTPGTELVSHLRATQKELDGQKVAGIMDYLSAGGKIDGSIPISRDGYIVDGHHRWAAEVGLDYQKGVDAGMTMAVDRIDQPVTQILAEANSFAQRYGIPQKSAFVPKVTDAATTAALKDATLPVLTADDVSFAADALGALHSDGGFSLDVTGAAAQTRRYVVALSKDHEQVFDPTSLSTSSVARYRNAKTGVLQQFPGSFLGGWRDPATGKVYLDVSTSFPNRETALRYAAANDQIAIWDAKANKEIVVPDAYKPKPQTASGLTTPESFRDLPLEKQIERLRVMYAKVVYAGSDKA